MVQRPMRVRTSAARYGVVRGALDIPAACAAGCCAHEGAAMNDQPTADVTPIRPLQEVLTRQRLPYFVGISGSTVGARGLSMHLVVIPPGARAEPHIHRGYETGIYVLEGRVETR